MAILAGLGEFVGGILIILGFLTPLAALALIAVMIVAIVTVHLKNGFFATRAAAPEQQHGRQRGYGDEDGPGTAGGWFHQGVPWIASVPRAALDTAADRDDNSAPDPRGAGSAGAAAATAAIVRE